MLCCLKIRQYHIPFQTESRLRNEDLVKQMQSLDARRKLLEADVEDRSRRLAEREGHIEVLDANVEELDRQLQATEQSVIDLENQIETERRQRQEELDAVVAELESKFGTHEINEIADLGILAQSLYARLHQAEHEISELERHHADFNRIHADVLNSVSLRLGRLITYPVRRPVQAVIARLEQGDFWPVTAENI